MTIQPARAIAWEIWRRFRWVFIIAAALIPFSAVLHLGLGGEFPELVGIFEGAAALLSLMALVVVFTFCEVDATQRTTGFPTRLFVLPIDTFKLVSLPVLYGGLALLCLYWVWTVLLNSLWGQLLSAEQTICYAVVIPAILVSLQTVLWSLPRFNSIRAVLLFLIAWAWLALIIAVSGNHPAVSPLVVTRVSALVFLLCYAIAIIAVKRERCGQWKGGIERSLQAFLDHLPWRQKVFCGSGAAQFWLEWRRRGWLLASICGLQTAGTLFVIPLPVALYLDSTSVLLGMTMLPFSMLWLSSFIGTGLAKTDGWQQGLALPVIVAVRPISTGDMVLAKFKVAAAITFLSLIILAATALPAMRAVSLYHGLNPGVLDYWQNFRTDHRFLVAWLENPIVILLFPALAWHAVIAAMYPGLSGNQRRTGWHMAFQIAIFTILLGLANWYYRHPSALNALLPVLPAIGAGWLIWKWAASVRAFRNLWKTRIFSETQYSALLLIWCGLTTGILYAAWLAMSMHQIPWTIVVFVAVWLLPGGQMAGCGMNLAANRHR
ncbi:MAG TPA: hypothetical protein VMZ27_02465 [Candidatus Saccharimonadales bacterium]|nr:hypothetical protein [Candidatus Saccharimonadales bacterium]